MKGHCGHCDGCGLIVGREPWDKRRLRLWRGKRLCAKCFGEATRIASRRIAGWTVLVGGAGR